MTISGRGQGHGKVGGQLVEKESAGMDPGSIPIHRLTSVKIGQYFHHF